MAREDKDVDRDEDRDEERDAGGKADGEDGARGKNKLAADRTNLAEDRTVLANERTFAGWMRTGLAAVGIGIAFNALFTKMEPVWVPKAIATAFLALGILIFFLAERRACSVLSRLQTHDVKTVGTFNLRVMTILMSLATIALIASIWVLRIQTR